MPRIRSKFADCFHLRYMFKFLVAVVSAKFTQMEKTEAVTPSIKVKVHAINKARSLQTNSMITEIIRTQLHGRRSKEKLEFALSCSSFGISTIRGILRGASCLSRCSHRSRGLACKPTPEEPCGSVVGLESHRVAELQKHLSSSLFSINP